MSQHGLNGIPGRRSSPGRRYRRLLISLSAAAVVPIVVYGSVQGWLRANAERRALDAANLEEAQRLALLVDNELMAELNGLRMLSLSHELDTDNLGGFYDLARRAHFENELWRSVIVIDPNTNEILLNTLFPIGSPYQPVQDPETVREVFEQHNAVIGAPTGPGFVPGTNRMHPAFVPLRVPVLRGDEMHYVLSASMSPDQLRALLWNISPPGLGGDSYLLDPYGHIVARNRSPGQFAELAPEALRTEIPKQEGMYRGSVDGDTLIVIERPRWLCLWRITWRSAFGRQTTRPDLPEGCPEQFDWSLMRDAWRYNADRRPRIEAERLKYGAQIPVVRLSSDREIEEFVDASSPVA